VFALFRFCLASFVYHKNSGWLEENTHSQDAIRVSPFWSEEMPHFDCAIVRYPWTSTDDTPEISGLPMDILYLQEIETLKFKMEELCNSFTRESKRLEDALSERFEHSLDMRSVGGEGYGLTDRPSVTAPAPPEAATMQKVVDEICNEMDYDVEEEEDVLLRSCGRLFGMIFALICSHLHS
jgi:hypothetical protein